MTQRSHVWFGMAVSAFGLSLNVVGCSGSPSGTEASSSAVTGGASHSGAADTDCRIVLREAASSTLNGGESYVDPGSPGGPSFVVFRGVIDVDTQLVATGGTVSVWYQGQGYAATTVQATACANNCEQGLDYLQGGQNPPSGFTRYSFATQANTVEEGTDGDYNLELIPYVTDAGGNALYDHNRTGGNYSLGGANYAVFDDFSVCGAPDPQGLVTTPAAGDAGPAATNLPTVTTGVGNTLNVSIALLGGDDDGTSYSSEYQLHVSYDDVTGYCRTGIAAGPGEVPGPAFIQAWAIFNTENVQTGTVSQDVRSFNLHVQPTGDFATYQNDGSNGGIGPIQVSVGGIHGVSDVKLHSVDFAFDCLGRYDSNNGQNYDVPLGDLQ